MVDREDVGRVLSQPLARIDVRMHGLPLDRPRPHERDLDGDVVEVLGPRAQEALHLRAALDLERPDRVGALDVVVDRRIVEGDAREVDHLVVDACDLLDAVLDRGEHPEAEEVDLEEARVRTRVLVPLAELATRHCRRLHGNELDEWPRRDDHPAGVLRDVAREAGDLPRQPGEGAPAPRLELPLAVGKPGDLLPHPLRVPAVGEPGEPLQLGEREPERLPHVADRAARAIRREARDERRVLAPVALGDADDELLADVAREVEVDVRHRRELAIQEAPERELVRDRVDVREAGEVADDRADRAAPSATRREEASGRVDPSHLPRALARYLQDFVVEEEEAGELELVDERELVFQAGACFRLQERVVGGIPLVERVPADRRQLSDRRLPPVREVGVAVPELLRQVELEAPGEDRAPLGGGAVEGEALEHLLGRAEVALPIAAPFGLATLERRAAANRDEHVLEKRAPRMMRVDVSGRDRLDAEVLCEVAKEPERRVSPRSNCLCSST